MAFPIVTITILLACIGFSLYAFSNREVFEKYMFNAYAIKHFNQKYRFLSHAFLHSDYGHLILNMYALYLFGSVLEKDYFPGEFGKMAPFFYILMFTGGIYASSIVDYIRNKDNQYYNAVGASGAVSSIMFSCILLRPLDGYFIIFFPFKAIDSWILGLVYLAYSFYMDRKKTDRIAHGAHAWGAVFGFVFTGILKPSLFVDFINQIILSFN
jgi:membrane associated rhomboid family serine protease